MSERKTDEIKFRIEPSRKAAWQQTAADEEIGLSKLIVRAVEEHRSSRNPQCSPGGRSVCTFPECKGGLECHPRKSLVDHVAPHFVAELNSSVAQSDPVAPTKNAQGAWQGNWRPWDDAA